MSKKIEKQHGPMGPGPKSGPGGPGGKPGINPNTLSRLIKLLFKFYPVMLPITIVCIVIAAVSSAMPAIFQQKVLADIGEWYLTGDWEGAAKVIMPKVCADTMEPVDGIRIVGAATVLDAMRSISS